MATSVIMLKEKKMSKVQRTLQELSAGLANVSYFRFKSGRREIGVYNISSSILSSGCIYHICLGLTTVGFEIAVFVREMEQGGSREEAGRKSLTSHLQLTTVMTTYFLVGRPMHGASV